MQRGSTRALHGGVAEGGRTTVGLDLSDTHSSLCVLDADGQVIEEGRVRTTTTALARRFAISRCRVIMEVGTLAVGQPAARVARA